MLSIIFLLFCSSLVASDNTFKPLGTLIDVGGFKLHLYQMGNQKPTVILDAFLGGNMLEWSLVQPCVAEFAQVCSYDRAGLGWSEQSNNPRTSAFIVEELRMLLRNAGIEPPYILVGHSSGGVNMRLFANMYPDEVFGLVLVDSSYERQAIELKELKNKFQLPPLPSSNDLSWLPSSLHEIYQQLQSKEQAHSTTHQERANFETSFQQVATAPNCLTHKPLIVITRGTKTVDNASPERKEYEQAFHQLWLEFQQDLLKKSERSKQIIAHGSGHMIQRDRPDLIVAAIHEMIQMYKKTEYSI